MSRAPTRNFYKVTVLGDGGVGKTALTIQVNLLRRTCVHHLFCAAYLLILQLCLNHFVETYDPTIEDSYRKQIHIDNTQCMLEVLDTAGQEEYTSLRDQWIRDGDGFLLVYSITSRTTFDRLWKIVEQIARVKDIDVQQIPIILVGNKSDMTLHREVQAYEAEAMAKSLNCAFIEASAKTGLNVASSFYRLASRIRDMRGENVKPPPESASLEQGSAQSARRQTSPQEGSEKRQMKRKKCIIM